MKNDPFGFDISVSSAKKKNPRTRRGMTGAVETSTRNCDKPGCEAHGQFRAPKSPDTLDDFWWFCKDHVREYNLKWNFFEGVPETELQDQIDKEKAWGPTKPFGKRTDEQRAWARLGVEDAHQVLGDNATRNHGRAGPEGGRRRLPPTERRAIEVLEVSENATKPEIRKAYKALIKLLHPDMNGGDRSQEEQLQQVVWAWEQVKDSRSFRDE
ncbi:J domain-containing protein [Ketogulonicigenium vulgare]|uniref:Heat shock protein DnaJ-like protein n=1 Tax=Ketogulonicigenium vulgare (strain WSH-001) TaxID=759362 RepID=F9Y7C1_KETVW|nr:J domain-containing protein [Ketogulonicigenium vulgare]ADO42862.1 chaperone protein DnaJ, putative [Ketogulonicigenium vulgare Y25]AEM41049.1 Heat shock protein DnaJ-like protein [Ketogulonicigenium vulgare WSH-001]ALJ81195.1 molecular chaperone DnaJ [Ketogulonicigenium vulgare]ANW33937.1 molecular chaperone DnaJ [Ketogulonicigenium vulgare]AOZ54775.1 chaperone protein DnaJ [Ketogulonicigenium vulgare]